MDQQALVSSIAVLYDHMDAQTAVVDMYRSFDEALPEQMARNVRLECKLQSLQDIAPPLSEFNMNAYRIVTTTRSNVLAISRRSWVNVQTCREKLQD